MSPVPAVPSNPSVQVTALGRTYDLRADGHISVSQQDSLVPPPVLPVNYRRILLENKLRLSRRTTPAGDIAHTLVQIDSRSPVWNEMVREIDEKVGDILRDGCKTHGSLPEGAAK